MDLPDDLELPLDRGRPWWYWLGGRPALDFVNSRRERWWRDVETLVAPRDLAEWIVCAGLLDEQPSVDEALLQRARELRESINSAAVALGEGRGCRGADVATIDCWVAEAALPDRLRARRGGSPVLTPGEPADPARHALGLIARDAAEMIGTDQRERIRVCASETCSARFYDRSRPGRRRWCSMSGCGNVAKARRHRARQASAG